MLVNFPVTRVIATLFSVRIIAYLQKETPEELVGKVISLAVTLTAGFGLCSRGIFRKIES